MNSSIQTTNKRIAKNTLLLYFRMMFMMAVNLYTSRVVLNVLGVEDFGIYNVVGGVVAFFSFFNSAMVSSTQRFITYELAKNDAEKTRNVFSTSINLHLCVAVVVLILSETVGIWLLREKMVIPEARHFAAFWTYQLSILTTIIAIMSCPYNAVIIAHEKMSAFAYISLLEAVLKLGIVFLLSFGNFDKLIQYAVLMVAVQLLVRFAYVLFCKKHFDETCYAFQKNMGLFKEMASFASWNMLGNLAAILFSQGLNILLNMFFTPIVNAARAISVQVQNAIYQFSYNFQVALNPQITKTYATGELGRMHTLVCQSGKYTFLLLYVLCLPVFFEAPFILKLWLKTVPDYTEVFLRIMMATMIIDSSANSLMISAAATGKVKKYQSVVGGILLLIVPISYIVLRLGGAPWSVFVVHLSVCCVAYVARLIMIRTLIDLKISYYLKKVVLRCSIVLFTSLLIPVILKIYLPSSLLASVCVIIMSVLSALFCGLFFGLGAEEKQIVFVKIKEYKRKILG